MYPIYDVYGAESDMGKYTAHINTELLPFYKQSMIAT